MDDFFNRRDFLKLVVANLALLGLQSSSWVESANGSNQFKDGTFRTFCKFCSSSCGLTVTTKNGVIIDVRGTASDPRSQGIICPKARQLGRFLSHPDRVVTPLVRTGKKGDGSFVPTSWAEALDRINTTWTAIIRNQGPQSIAGYLGGTVGLESLWLLPRLFNCLGSPNVFCPTVNINGGFAFAGTATTGIPAAQSVENVGQSRCIVLGGCNPDASNPILLSQINRARQRGAKLIVINPERIPLADHADQWIPIRPGTDGALALSIAQTLIRENLQNSDFINQWVEGYDAFKELVFRADYQPENVAEICQIPSDQIIRACRLYGTERPGLIIGGLGLNAHSQGFQASRAVHCLAALTGNINKPGANLYYGFPVPPLKGLATLAERRNALGGRQSATLVNLAVDYPDTLRLWDLINADGSDSLWKTDVFRRATSEARPPYAENDVYRNGYSGTAYPLRSLFLLRGDPLATLPNTVKGNLSLSKIEFLVAATHFLTPGVRYADIVLPLAYPPECSEFANTIFPNPEKYLLLREQVLPAPEKCLSEQELIITLGKALGFYREFDTTQPRFVDHIFSTSPFTKHLSCQAIQQNPIKRASLFTEEKLFPSLRQVTFPTPTGKIMLTSTGMEKTGFNPLPEWAPPVESRERTPDFFQSYPLTLITGKTEEDDPAAAIISPSDAAIYKIATGDEIMIESKVGSAKFIATISDAVIPGVVKISTESYLGEPVDPASSNKWQYLVDHRFNDPIIGAPRTNEMPVRVVRP